MRKYILSVWSLACLLAYCGGSQTNENLNDKKSDDKTESLVFPMRINGPTGYLYVDVKGDGGIPILFAHSFGGSAEHWKNQVMHYEKTRKVVSFDFRGHGRSDSSNAYLYKPVDLAKDIEAVAEFMKLDKFILVGHSMGGSAAIAYTAKHPQKVAGLVLVGTPGKANPEQSQKIMASLKSPAYQKVMDTYMQQLLKNARPDVSSFIMQDFTKMSRPTSLSIIESEFNYDPLPDLEKYKGPLLIVLTDQENKQPQSLNKQVKTAKAVVIKGTSHWIQLDKPQEFNQELDHFLEENKL